MYSVIAQLKQKSAFCNLTERQYLRILSSILKLLIFFKISNFHIFMSIDCIYLFVSKIRITFLYIYRVISFYSSKPLQDSFRILPSDEITQKPAGKQLFRTGQISFIIQLLLPIPTLFHYSYPHFCATHSFPRYVTTFLCYTHFSTTRYHISELPILFRPTLPHLDAAYSLQPHVTIFLCYPLCTTTRHHISVLPTLFRPHVTSVLCYPLFSTTRYNISVLPTLFHHTSPHFCGTHSCPPHITPFLCYLEFFYMRTRHLYSAYHLFQPVYFFYYLFIFWA